MIRRIGERISYIPSTEEPLSADIALIKGKEKLWLFDVGNNDEQLKNLNGDGVYNAVISHFHIDHLGSLKKLKISELYVSKTTFKYSGFGNIVEEDLFIDDLHIFPLPSSHAKGSLGLECDGYVFTGDALYGKGDGDEIIYNAQLLKEEIAVLEKLKSTKIISSHQMDKIKDKAEVLKELKEIYSLRSNKDPYIRIKR